MRRIVLAARELEGEREKVKGDNVLIPSGGMYIFVYY
jgi:hypothetical protein